MASCSEGEGITPVSALVGSISLSAPPLQTLDVHCVGSAGTQTVPMFEDGRDKVLRTEALLGEIFKRTGSSKYYLRASLVTKFWRCTAQVSIIACEFARRNKPCFLGFIVEHGQGYGPELVLLSPPGTPARDPVDVMREKFYPFGFADKYVLGTYGGRIISRAETGCQKGRFYMSCPFSPSPSKFSKVARPVPLTRKFPDDSIYGQFVLLCPDYEGSNSPVFFVKDDPVTRNKNYDGVNFMKAETIRVHVAMYIDKKWFQRSSDPFPTPGGCTLQRTPYSVQAGRKLYLMYLVGCIVRFDMDHKTFEVVQLPGELPTAAVCCLQYTVGPHPEGDLAVVHMDGGRLVRWMLPHSGDMADWHQEASLELVPAFGVLMNSNVSTALSVHPGDWRSIQVRSVSPDGQYVLISVGVLHGLFIVDMVKNKVYGSSNVGKIGRVFPFSENWPPKP